MKSKSICRTTRYVLWLLLIGQSAARADVGVPMIFITLPMMAVALVPIILVETLILSRRLWVKFVPAVKAVGWANVASTFLGIPVTWLALAFLEGVTGGGTNGIATLREKFVAVTWQAPWLIPWDSDLYWMIPTATLVLLVPFFFVSWLTEYQIACPMLPDVAPAQVKRGMLLANLASYGLLALWVMVQLVVALHTRSPVWQQ